MHKTSGTRVLVIAAHPDDETFGCGGTMATLAAQGADVGLLVVTCHAVNTGSLRSREQPVGRESELAEAAAALGVRTVEIVNSEIRHTDVLYSMLPELVSLIEKDAELSLDRFQPQIVLIPSRMSFHQDHQLVSQAAFAACRIRGGSHWLPTMLLGYACPEDQWSQSPEQPTTFVDITESYTAKQAAIAAYAKQLKEGLHPRTLPGIANTDRVVGARIGVEYAESFITYRNVVHSGSML